MSSGPGFAPPLARWDFGEDAAPFASHDGRFLLRDGDGSAVAADGGGAEPRAARFDGIRDHLVAAPGDLDLAGADGCSVFAWVHRESAGMHFIAGLWQEDDRAPGRQYALFVNLPMYGGEQRVCGHVSRTGGATPGYPYSRDYSTSAGDVPVGRWTHIGFTYDGRLVTSYLDGQAQPVPHYLDPQGETYAKNPYRFDDGLNPRPRGVFTVGSNRVSAGMRMHFSGRMAALAVVDRALSADEVSETWTAERMRFGR